MKARLHVHSLEVAPARQPARSERARVPDVQQTEAASAETLTAEHDFATIPIFSPEQLLDRASEGTPIPLPRRAELEKYFGFRLGQIDVYTGEDAALALDELGAKAAAYDGAILLADPNPELSLLAHEVAHIVQNDNSAGLSVNSSVETEAQNTAQTITHRADQTNVAAFQPMPLMAELTPQTPAFQTAEALVLEPETAAPEQAAQAFQAAAQAPTGEAPAPAAEVAPTEEVAPATQAEAEGETETTAPAEEGAQPTAAAEEGETPALELPPAPQPGVTEEDVAAQEAALEAAQEAMAHAENPEQAMEAFVNAPPTLKAQAYDNLGQNMNQLATQEDQTFQAEVPDFHAELNTQAEPAPELTVGTPEGAAGELEAVPPPPAPEVELPLTPDLGDYTANDRIAGIARRLPETGDDRAREIGGALRDVSTTDPEITNSPGEPPAVPLAGETDPARIDNQRDEAAEQSRGARDDAHTAVMTGPGPEQVQPVNMDEVYPVGELTAPTLQPPAPVEGTDAYLQMGLPIEVQTAFDQDQQQQMQASLSGAQAEVQTATDTRDQERQASISEAEEQTATLSEDADEQQRTQVQTAREQIQTERQDTLDQQTQAVTDMESEVETDRADSQRQIDDRVQQDEADIRSRYDQAETDAQAEIDRGEQQAEAERRQAEEEAEEESWWDAVTDFIADAFEALTSLINGIFDAVRSAVNSILDAVKDFAKGLIDLAANFIKDAITAFGEALKAAVNTLLAETFPELAAALNEAIDSAVAVAHEAVDAVAETLKAGIDALVEGLRAALNAIIDAYQAAVNAALAILQAAITGDWAGLIIKVLEAILRVAGIDPAEVYAFIGRAQETIQIIVDDPGAFLGHLVDAFVGGVQNFADNFLTHLQAGIIGWLTGALGSAGITIPERFDLFGVLDLVRQILGLTWERLRAKAVRLIGEQNVERLEFIASYIETLITGGWGALWERIQQDLGTLVDTILDGIKNYLIERIIIAAITRLATLFNPVGAIVQLVLAVYNFYTFLRDQIQRIYAVLQTIVNAIGDIARGVIEPAALRVEEVLASLLPLAIDLLARLLGLGNVGARVREIIEQVQATVDRAIDALIERVLSAFRGGGAAGAQPGAQQPAEEQPAADGSNRIGEDITITVPGEEPHHFFIEVRGHDATLVVQSTRRTVPELSEYWHANIDTQNSPLDTPEKKQQARTLLGQLDARDDSVEATAEAATSGTTPATQVVTAQRTLSALLTDLFRLFGTSRETSHARRITEKYGDELHVADPDAEQRLFESLMERPQVYLDKQTWNEVKAELKTRSDFIQRPLLTGFRFGEVVRQELTPEIQPAFDELRSANPNSRLPANVNDIFNSRVAMIHSKQTPFLRSLDLLQEQIFDGQRKRQAQMTLREEYVASLESYAAGTEEHEEYEPVFLAGYSDSSFPTIKYTYKGTHQPEFEVTLTDPRTQQTIQGNRLRSKHLVAEVLGRRGITDRSPDFRENFFLNASHLIADEFTGSGWRQAHNLITTSAYYNQVEMRDMEVRIGDFIKGIANLHAGGSLSNVTFNMKVDAKFGSALITPDIQQRVKTQILDRFGGRAVHAAAFERDWQALSQQLVQRAANLKRVLEIEYEVTVLVNDQPVPNNEFRDKLGPDIYLGMDPDKLRRLLGR